jgi:hypothetical protein
MKRDRLLCLNCEEATPATLRSCEHCGHTIGAKRLPDEAPLSACRACGRGTLGRFCYWCGKRRGLW